MVEKSGKRVARELRIRADKSEETRSVISANALTLAQKKLGEGEELIKSELVEVLLKCARLIFKPSSVLKVGARAVLLEMAPFVYNVKERADTVFGMEYAEGEILAVVFVIVGFFLYDRYGYVFMVIAGVRPAFGIFVDIFLFVLGTEACFPLVRVGI